MSGCGPDENFLLERLDNLENDLLVGKAVNPSEIIDLITDLREELIFRYAEEED